MNDSIHQHDATAAEWAAILAESEAEAEAGLLVSGDDVMRELYESIARMEGRLPSQDQADRVLPATLDRSYASRQPTDSGIEAAL